MNLDTVLWIVICVAGLYFFAIPFLPSDKKSTAAFLIVALNSITTSIPAIFTLTGHPVEFIFFGGSVFGNIPVRYDALSSWFILIINFTCFNGAWYGMGYMKPYTDQKQNTSLHWILFVVFHLSMLAVCMLQHSLAFLVVWEIMSISSLLLVIFEHYKYETIKAGINYLVQMHIGVAIMSVAFMWVYISTGTFEFAGIASFFSDHPPALLFILFFIGFGIKAGFIPLHTWLPHAHPAAPSHVSGVMSGVIVKLGIYGILRIIFYLSAGFTWIGVSILLLSIITVFYGILNAAVYRDFKKMLAFCTIENIGIIGMGIGIGLIGKGANNQSLMLLGFSAALLHTLNHSLYKSLLFFAAGNIYQQTHTRNMEQLGGLIKNMPLTAFLFLCGSLAITGIPPFNGFVSEFLVYSGLLEGIKSEDVQFNSIMILCIASLALAGGISILTFTKTFGTIFLGTPRISFDHPPKEVSMIMRFPLFLLLLVMLTIGIFPNLFFMPALHIAGDISGISAPEVVISLSPAIVMAGRSSLVLFILTFLIYFIRARSMAAKTLPYSPTWACGYVAPNEKMQYTAKSFSKSFAKLFSFIVAEKKYYHEIGTHKIFPQPRAFHSNYQEFFEKNFIGPVSNRLFAFMNYFSFIHNGKLQMYILYGFFFIMILIASTFFNLL